MAKKVAYRKKRQNRFGMFLVSLVVIMLLVAVAYKSRELRVTRDENYKHIAELEIQIEEEEKRKEELVKKEKRMQTKEFVEEMAKRAFKLVYPNDTIFIDESK
ncbi:MAG: septum formation initiator family protein [Lachnospiraceae bacterium]|nr:septum formation initiator family protein [Lachnospiraceae bacterium]